MAQTLNLTSLTCVRNVFTKDCVDGCIVLSMVRRGTLLCAEAGTLLCAGAGLRTVNIKIIILGNVKQTTTASHTIDY